VTRLLAASADALPELEDAIAWLGEIAEADPTFEVPPTSVEVCAPREDEMRAYTRTFMEGLREPEQTWSDAERERLEREMVAEFGDPRCWRLLLATVDGEHAGIGTLWLDGDVAFFSNGATVPRFRGRGVHRVLIRARLTHAARAGARIAYVDTTVSSIAERNLHRHGFRLVCHLGMWSRLPRVE
jgi:GNAT superfamily N-acetyltransferase